VASPQFIEIRYLSEIPSCRFGTAEDADYADKRYTAASVSVVSVLSGQKRCSSNPDLTIE